MVKKFALKNGLRILLVPQSGGVATTVLILVAAGSEYESKRTNGISHFLEHMVFKGTAKRPEPGMVARELDALGAEYNAFTSQEYTGYWAKAENRKVHTILEIISDLYLNPVFNSEEINKERGVVIEEINLYEDTPARRVHDVFVELLYGDQPAGWDVAGEKRVIRALTREDLVRYRGEHYAASGTLVVVSGNFDARSVKSDIAALFGALARTRRRRKPATRERQRTPAVAVKFKESDQSHLVLGVRAFDLFDTRRYALNVLADVLGGGMSSRLFHRIREELGAAYYVRAGADLLLDHGFFAVSAGVDHAKIHTVLPVILEEFTRLTKEYVGAEELKKAKEHVSGGLLLGLETSDELASYYGGQEFLRGSFLSPAEFVDRIKKVTPGEIRTLARALFQDAKLNLAVIGPYKHEKPFRKALTL